MTQSGPHAEAIAATMGMASVEVIPVVAGASNLAYEIRDPADPAGPPIAFLRSEGHGALRGSKYDLHREAQLLPAAAALGFPVADVLATYHEPTALLMAVVPGTSRPDPETLDQVAAEYMGLVARLHDSDPTRFPVEQYPTVRAANLADLAFWDGLVAEAGVGAVPLLAAARLVLEATMPADDRPPVLVHGDVGPGNFMIHNGRVAAMLDWELAHVGDPHEDLAWMWMRGAHTDFGDPLARIDEYTVASQRTLDRDALRWQLAAVMWKSCASMEVELRSSAAGQATLIHVVVLLAYQALLGAQLVRLTGGSFALLGQQPNAVPGPAMRAAERLAGMDDLPREAAIIAEYLARATAQSSWERTELESDVARMLPVGTGDLVGHATAANPDLGALSLVLARAADRAAMAMPKAVRRIERAQGIGLGTADEPMPGGAR